MIYKTNICKIILLYPNKFFDFAIKDYDELFLKYNQSLIEEKALSPLGNVANNYLRINILIAQSLMELLGYFCENDDEIYPD